MLLLEIILAVVAFRKGWRWRAFLPIAIGFGMGMLIGAAVGASGGSLAEVMPLAVLVDIVVLVTLGVMVGRAPVVVPATTHAGVDPAPVDARDVASTSDRAAI